MNTNRCKLSIVSLFTITCALVFLTSSISISAKKSRIALVIGNGAYKSSPLGNPVNDANDMAAALKNCNFRVMKSINASRRQMRKAIRKFGIEINKGAVGLFYYAGHGIQVDGENYLVPVNAEVYTEAEVEDECLKVSSVLRQMESAGNRLNIIILDACRDNPFGRSFRSSNMGLAKMDAPTGSILAYATAPGSIAADGVGRNGLYTSKLLKHMMETNLPIERVFKRVRIDVVTSSGKRQTPWESSSLMGDFYFNAKRGIAVKKQTTVELEKPAKKTPESEIPKAYTIIEQDLSKKTPESEIPKAYTIIEQDLSKKTPKYSSISPKVSQPEVIKRDGRFIAYDNGTVKDTKTGLMWASNDNGEDLNWYNAKRYCENYRGGGYTDWRMPTQDELAELYDESESYQATQRTYNVHLTELIGLSACCPWASETRGANAATFHFDDGTRYWYVQSGSNGTRALPVRSGN